jgi:hypothetical protein
MAYVIRLRDNFKGSDNLTFLKDTAKVINYIDTTPTKFGKPPSINTLKTYYTHIVSVIRDKGDEGLNAALEVYRAKMSNARDTSDAVAKLQVATPAEDAKWIDWNDILKVRDSLKPTSNSSKQFQNYLILCLYTMIEPQRLDYSPMRFVTADTGSKTENLCVLNDTGAVFIFNAFKTKEWYEKKYGEVKKMTASAELFEVLKTWRTINTSDWLITKTDGKTPLSDVMLGQRIQAIFEAAVGKKTSVDILRHSYVSFMRQNEMKLVDKENMAKNMGHSASMNEMYRRLR